MGNINVKESSSRTCLPISKISRGNLTWKNIRSLTGLSAIHIPSGLAQTRRMKKFVRVIGWSFQSPGQIFLISCSPCFPLKNELAQCILREREKIWIFQLFFIQNSYYLLKKTMWYNVFWNKNNTVIHCKKKSSKGVKLVDWFVNLIKSVVDESLFMMEEMVRCEWDLFLISQILRVLR